MCISVGHGRASAAEAEQLASCTLLELLVLTVGIHALAVIEVVDVFAEQVAHGAFQPPAGHHVTRRQYGHVAVGAMATVINRVVVQSFGNLEQPFFIEEERPEMVFQVERCAGVLVLLELLPDAFQEVSVLRRLDVGALLEAGGTIASEGKDVHPVLHHQVDDVGYLTDVSDTVVITAQRMPARRMTAIFSIVVSNEPGLRMASCVSRIPSMESWYLSHPYAFSFRHTSSVR